jgi:LAGLIDADG endonuclease
MKDINHNDQKFNEWLAGLIDGDGSLLVSKDGYTSCEITIGEHDEKALIIIKNKLGGSLKLRSGVKAFRYRLHHKNGIIDLVGRINGHIRNSKRLFQLIKVCKILNIPFIDPILLSTESSWYAGFFDADGTIYAKFDSLSPTIIIAVANKDRKDLEPFLVFKGKIYHSKSGYGHYFWSISSESDILSISEYFKVNPLRSHKLARFHNIKEFYYLRSLKAHKQDVSSSLHKRWIMLKLKWSKWSNL